MKPAAILELIYLVAAIGLASFLAFEYKDLEVTGVIALCVAIGICTFMYSFRRRQRLAAEERDRKGKGGGPS